MRKHYLLTPFNMVRAPDFAADPPIHREDYLENRCQLFERFCYPSVRNQTTDDFSWIVMFSDGTPDRYRERIARLAEAMPNMRVVYLDPAAALKFFGELASYLALDDATTRVITSRVDNDDALAVDFIECTQAVCDARPNEDYFISFPKGLRLSSAHGFSAVRWRTDNHYLSLHTVIQDRGRPLDNVMRYNHTKVHQSGKRIVVAKAREVMWLEVNHDSNVRNRMTARSFLRPALDTRVYTRFALDPRDFSLWREGRLLLVLRLAAKARVIDLTIKAWHLLRTGLRRA